MYHTEFEGFGRASAVQGTAKMNDRLIRACRREPVDRTPVWMMRQAGRYLKEYRQIRQNVAFLDLCKNVDLASEVSLQPLRILGVDAVIFFSDILIPVEAMGVNVALTDKGPEIASPIRSRADIDKLRTPDPGLEVPFVGNILRKLRTEIRGEVPLIGFSGAPWTLASYMIEGGGSKSFAEIKKLAFAEPGTLRVLLDKLASTIISYLRFQIESGAQVVQLFDTWAGELNRRDYEQFALPVTQRIFEEIGSAVPRILYINGCSAILESMATSGADVISVDWRLPISEAASRVGNRVTLQGNLDPCALLGSPVNLTATAADILEQAGPTGHIFNLGHGILPMTPVENARTLIDFVKEYRHRR
jgi:uroporphyrinogen decarboxylase